jgi:Ca2+-binding EF-hand superfamily protein
MADFTLGPGASEPLKAFVKAIEPYGIKGGDGSALRKTGFSEADMNGTGMASLAEVENFISFALQDSTEDEDEAKDLFKLFRGSYIVAFNLAKALGKSSGKVLKGATTATADDYISFPEFRMFCVYATICAAMFDVFTMVDGGSSGVSEDDDSRISLDEFLGGWKSLGGLGFKALQGLSSDEAAKALFQSVDTNDGGFILFKEWANYIKKQEIKAKTHIGTLLSGNLKTTKIGASKLSARSSSTPRGKTRPEKVSVSSSVRSTSTPRTRGSTRPVSGSARPSPVSVPRSAPRTPASASRGGSRAASGSASSAPATKSGMTLSAAVDGAYKPSSSSKNLKEFIKSIQPYTEKTAEGKKLRKFGFGKCDMNGSGECSLAEVDGFVLTNLKSDYGPKLGEKLFKTFRSSYIVAYNGAKDLKANAKGNDDDYINFAEFRVLSVYLCVYAGMLDAFATVDGGGAGVSADDDRRIGTKEWMKGYAHIKTTGFVGLAKLHNDDDARAAFQSMDADNSGRVIFSDFCNYLSAAEVDAGSKLGGLFSGNGLQLRALNDTPLEDVTPPPQDLPEEALDELLDESVGEEEEPFEEEEPEEPEEEEEDEEQLEEPEEEDEEQLEEPEDEVEESEVEPEETEEEPEEEEAGEPEDYGSEIPEDGSEQPVSEDDESAEKPALEEK